MVVEELDIVDALFCLELAEDVFVAPVEGSDVALFATHDDVSTISGDTKPSVWSKIRQIQVKNVLSRLDWKDSLQLMLLYL